MDAAEIRKRASQIKQQLMRSSGPKLLDELSNQLAAQEWIIEQLTSRMEKIEAAQDLDGAMVSDRAESHGPPAPATAAVRMDEFLSSEQGFYELEHDANGAPYRWTGPSRRFAFEVHVDRAQAVTAFLQVISSVAPEQVSGLTATCDGRTVRVTAATRGGVSGVAVELPARKGGRPTLLAFEVPRTISPNSVDPSSPDQRSLGMAIGGLLLEPTRR